MADRLTTLVHHITTLCQPDQLGRTRLAKILWLSDVENFRRTGKTVSGSDDYRKDDYGPRHHRLYEAIKVLTNDGHVVPREALTPVGPRHELIPLTTPNLEGFSADEIAIVDRVTAAVIKLSAKEASDLTHDELWESSYNNERIPVAAAAPVCGDFSAELARWADEAIDADRETGHRI